MEKKQTLYIGFDLNNDYSQISCYIPRTGEVKTLGKTKYEKEDLIPTVLAVNERTREWLYGEDALMLGKFGQGVLVNNLLEGIRKGRQFEVFGARLDGVTLLEKFFKKALARLGSYFPNDAIKMMVVTVDSLNQNLVNAIYQSLEGLGIMKDRVTVHGHGQSYLSYTLHQRKEIWMNDVGLFDFSSRGLFYYRLAINRKENPMVIGIVRKDFSKQFSYEMLKNEEGESSPPALFGKLANSVLYKQVISTIFATGIGFSESWADEVFKKICAGRRVFRGQNLYSTGACYSAVDICEGKMVDYVYLGEETVGSTVSIPLYTDAKVEKMVLLKAGSAWYDIDETAYVILDEEEELRFEVKDITMKERAEHILTMENMPSRPNKMTRLRINATCVDQNTCVIRVKDMGFGEYYASTQRVWEKIIAI
ncbi:MAG: hypothetical protein K6G65_02395 [Lachnospiraceae bacterium]|nr:hypothetical protein [Lachnospiraceae bacterium]